MHIFYIAVAATACNDNTTNYHVIYTTVCLMQAPPEEDSGDDEASDSKGIRGWDSLDALAEALLQVMN